MKSGDLYKSNNGTGPEIARIIVVDIETIFFEYKRSAHGKWNQSSMKKDQWKKSGWRRIG